MIVRSKAWLLALGFAFLAGPGGANPPAIAPKAVVELFTSQGCSSCPPADKLLAELAERSDLVALTLPVDYWDYLGWKDTLAHPLFSARQRGYAYARGDRQVYTPQAVVNGSKPCLGSDRAQVEQSIAGAGPQGLPVPLTVSERDGIVTVGIEAAPDRTAIAELWVLPVMRSQTVPIGRGENEGRTVTYANVVRGMTRLGEWRGGSAQFELPLAAARGDGDGYVVLLQSRHGKKPGPIIGAAKSRGL
jgi:hypothetical protein